MATLVLTAAGSLLGPLGGAAGALLGQAIDGRILRPKGREGPRLQDLRIQASSYGAPLPKLFGRMRVAGTVIWSTDLVESRNRKGGGKGRPSTTSYSYSASFAVALSSRPIRSVQRIWADGNLLRGAAGDWKHETGFRLHLGSEDQGVDPFIASAEGSGTTPAYRGCAYAVFENMALEPYGNRIPSLTFEVEADAGPVTIGNMLGSISDGDVRGEDGSELVGFAAEGDSLSGLIEGLSELFPLEFRDTGDQLELRSSGQPAVQLDAAEIMDGSRSEVPRASEAPAALMLSYYDPARDYQIGVQSAGAGHGRAVRRVELPATVSAPQAQSFAEAALYRIRRSQRRSIVWCGWQRLDLEQGAFVSLPSEGGIWRVAEKSAERTGVRLELVMSGSASIVPAQVDSGRALPAPDRVHGPTRIALLDLPDIEDEPATASSLLIAAWGETGDWRRATLLLSLDEGKSWEPIGTSAQAAIAGEAESALPPAGTAIIDEASEVVVQLAHGEMMLEDADGDGLLSGRNLALVGDELLQFGSALPLGGSRWRLSRLLRGRRGTEWAVGAHVAGERFVLVERDALAVAPVPLGAMHQPISVMASGIGDPTPVEASIDFDGEVLRPLSPVHLSYAADQDGGVKVSWVRRSRSGLNWGEVDVPLGEAVQRYRLAIRRSDGAERIVELDQPRYSYGAGAMATDRATGTFVDVSVEQIGNFALSRAANIRIDIGES